MHHENVMADTSLQKKLKAAAVGAITKKADCCISADELSEDQNN